MRKNIRLSAAAYYNRNPRSWARRRNSKMHLLDDDLFALCDHVVDFHEIIGEGRDIAGIALPHNFTELIRNQLIQDRKIAMVEFVNVTTNDRLIGFGSDRASAGISWIARVSPSNGRADEPSPAARSAVFCGPLRPSPRECP
jgi:hypothetical protein